jgi:hypothetical protein
MIENDTIQNRKTGARCVFSIHPPLDQTIQIISFVFIFTGSVWMAFGVLSIFGLRSPLKFVPILVMQLCYKSIWFIGVVFPMLVSGTFPLYAILHVVIMGSYIVGDLIAIPFPYVFSRTDTANSKLTLETA